MSGKDGLANGGRGDIDLGSEADDLHDLSVPTDAPVPVAIAHDVRLFDGNHHSLAV